MTGSRRTIRHVILWLLITVLGGCGKKGPPLAPLLIVPAQITEFEVTRLNDRVYMEFKVPEANQTGDMPADLDRVEIYALTTQPALLQPSEPFSEDWLDLATLVASVPIRPPLPLGTTADDTDPEPVVDTAQVLLPRQGDVVTIVEEIAPDVLIPVTLYEPEVAVAAVSRRPQPFVSLLPLAPIRSYVAFGVSTRNREGPDSAMLAISLVDPPAAPAAPIVSYTSTSIQVDWEAPATAALPVQGGESAMVGALESTPVLAGREPSRYVLYDVTKLTTPDTAKPEPLGIPSTALSFSEEGITFGVRRCYALRVLDVIQGFEIQSAESVESCIVPIDTFVPAAPTGLTALADDVAINLTWDDNAETDIAGYLVLRGRTTDATLESLTPEPVVETTYRDTTLEPGEQYMYQVMAVDTAAFPNISPPSERVIETAP